MVLSLKLHYLNPKRLVSCTLTSIIRYGIKSAICGIVGGIFWKKVVPEMYQVGGESISSSAGPPVAENSVKSACLVITGGSSCSSLLDCLGPDGSLLVVYPFPVGETSRLESMAPFLVLIPSVIL